MVMASKANNIIRLIGDAKNIDCQYVKDGDDRVTYIGNSKLLFVNGLTNSQNKLLIIIR